MKLNNLKKLLFATLKAEAPRYLVGFAASTEYMTTGKFPEWTPKRNPIKTKNTCVDSSQVLEPIKPEERTTRRVVLDQALWSCPYCNSLNFGYVLRCEYCGAGRQLNSLS